eukprot:5877944-Amphidinium_carterae.1
MELAADDSCHRENSRPLAHMARTTNMFHMHQPKMSKECKEKVTSSPAEQSCKVEALAITINTVP